MQAASGHPIALACQAMGTRFELLLRGDDPVRLRSAGEAALEEVRRWHDLLSLFDRASVIARLNREAADHSVPVPPEIATLLRLCQEATTATEGAFNPAIGHLMRTAGFRDAPRGRTPTVREGLGDVTHAQQPQYHIDPQNRVTFSNPAVAFDLGAIGKGWALDRAAEILRERGSGVSSALLHGGTSSVITLGGPWRIALDATTALDLTDEALGLSAPAGRQFTDDAGQSHGHILNPRTGESASVLTAAAVTGPSAAVCDAWSTALVVNPALVQAPAWPIGYLAHTNTGTGFHQPTHATAQGTPA